MKYLISGGAGFIGSHLAEALLARGEEVVILDNLATGQLANLSAILDRITFVQGSILDPLLVDEQVASVDIAVHLAAAVGVRLVVDRPLHSFLTNIRGTENILEAAHRYRRKVLIASTSEVYGKGVGKTFAEDDDRLVGSNHIARWGYATSKSVDEILAFAYHRERGLPTVIVRFFNTTGPRQTGAYGMVLPSFVSQALSGDELTVYGDGEQSRCFCHVEDVVDAVMRLLDDPRAEGDVFNIGSTEEVTIRQLAERVIASTQSKSTIRYIPYDQAYKEGFEDMRRRVPDITKIKALTGWEPARPLDLIIRDTVEFQMTSETSVQEQQLR